MAIASIKTLADQQAANLPPVIREIRRTGGLGVIARPVRSTSRAFMLRFLARRCFGSLLNENDTGVVHFREVSINASKTFAGGEEGDCPQVA